MFVAEATCDNGEITVNDLPEECLCEQVLSVEEADEERCDPSPLLEALVTHQWNVSEVARFYKVSRPTIYRWMQHQGIQHARFLGKLKREQ